MINMHSKYDNMHRNGIFNALICINNNLIITISCNYKREYTCHTPFVIGHKGNMAHLNSLFSIHEMGWFTLIVISNSIRGNVAYSLH